MLNAARYCTRSPFCNGQKGDKSIDCTHGSFYQISSLPIQQDTVYDMGHEFLARSAASFDRFVNLFQDFGVDEIFCRIVSFPSIL